MNLRGKLDLATSSFGTVDICIDWRTNRKTSLTNFPSSFNQAWATSAKSYEGRRRGRRIPKRQPMLPEPLSPLLRLPQLQTQPYQQLTLRCRQLAFDAQLHVSAMRKKCFLKTAHVHGLDLPIKLLSIQISHLIQKNSHPQLSRAFLAVHVRRLSLEGGNEHSRTMICKNQMLEKKIILERKMILVPSKVSSWHCAYQYLRTATYIVLYRLGGV